MPSITLEQLEQAAHAPLTAGPAFVIFILVVVSAFICGILLCGLITVFRARLIEALGGWVVEIRWTVVPFLAGRAHHLPWLKAPLTFGPAAARLWAHGDPVQAEWTVGTSFWKRNALRYVDVVVAAAVGGAIVAATQSLPPLPPGVPSGLGFFSMMVGVCLAGIGLADLVIRLAGDAAGAILPARWREWLE